MTDDGVGGGGGAINQKSFGATISKNIKRFWLNIKWSNQAFYVASVGGGVCVSLLLAITIYIRKTFISQLRTWQWISFRMNRKWYYMFIFDWKRVTLNWNLSLASNFFSSSYQKWLTMIRSVSVQSSQVKWRKKMIAWVNINKNKNMPSTIHI